MRYFVGALLGLIVGNFVFQFISSEPDYSKAVERSYFQALVGIEFLIIYLINKYIEISK